MKEIKKNYQAKEFWTTEETCNYLSVTEKTLRGIVYSGELKRYKILTRKYLYRAENVRSYVLSKEDA